MGQGPMGVRLVARPGTWAYHTQQEGSGAVEIGQQSTAGALAVSSVVMVAGFWDMKCHLAGGKKQVPHVLRVHTLKILAYARLLDIKPRAKWKISTAAST